MNLLSTIHPAYGLYLAMIIGGGTLAVLADSLVRALSGLIITLFGVAGMYLLMAAPFLAFMQILIYVGAVTVLIFFAIMLTRSDEGVSGTESGRKGKKFMAVWASVFPSCILLIIVTRHMPKDIPLKPEVSMGRLGEFLTGPYALSFELISAVLFVAMAGAVLLGFERRKAK
jgi:NADH-quinone oxidoreductase subunit J